MPEVAAREAALVGQRADDLARLDLVALADLEAVRRHRLAAARLPRMTVGLAGVGRPLVEGAGGALGLRLEQERLLAVHHRGEGGSHVDLGDVVLTDVVGHDVAEEVDPLGLRERLGDLLVEA